MEDKIKCYMHSQLCENVPEELCTLMEEEEELYVHFADEELCTLMEEEEEEEELYVHFADEEACD